MERDLEKDDFELFLQQKADQHKLYPSEKSWRTIYNSLHPGMKWLKIGGTFLFLSSLFFVYHENLVNNTPRLSSDKPSGSIQYNSTIPPAASVTKDERPTVTHSAPVNALKLPINAGTYSFSNTGRLPNSAIDKTAINENRFASSIPVQSFLSHALSTVRLSGPVNVTIPRNTGNNAASPIVVEEKYADNENAETLSASVVSGNTTAGVNAIAIKELNWLQEMAAIRLTVHKKSKFNLQFYFSPTLSYRRLADNQNTSHSSILNTFTIPRDLNINRYVDHNPAIGAELGSNMLYAVNKNLTLKSGLQLNYSRYNIKAFKYSYEKASIALKSAGPIADTLSSYTSLRNFSGYAPEDLQNQYLQVSVPIGAELKLLGNKRLQFNVAGTIQPTLLLYSDTYLLSTNYINYTKEPSLVRKWNLHSSFEAFLSYKTGGLRWQLGPQFRYQLMSSFNDRYPIKEYLLEYGVKFGVSKTLR